MRKSITITVILATLATLLATSLKSDMPNYYYGSYSPVFMTRVELEKSVKYLDEVREIKDPAKIYVRGSQIFVSERYKGVHIIDNSVPSNMRQVGFITAPGCIDMAVKGNILYVDNAVDLVAFDLDAKVVTERLVGLLPEPASPDGYDHGYYDRPEGLICVGWKQTPEDE
jgi:hypothetical protein